jgi:hypothetical protein
MGMGLVCTIQRVNVVLKTGDAKRLVVRDTDCFEKRNGEWKLIHQHASVPSGGDWDGKEPSAVKELHVFLDRFAQPNSSYVA